MISRSGHEKIGKLRGRLELAIISCFGGMSGGGLASLLHPTPNPYEVPLCQETDYPQERSSAFFFRCSGLAQSVAGVVS